MERTVSSGMVMKTVVNIPITRYNFETVELLRENLKKWTEEIRSQRCASPKKSDASGTADSEASCEGIQFYLVEVDLNGMPDKSERAYLKGLPTSFHLAPEAVDRLRRAGGRILRGRVVPIPFYDPRNQRQEM